MRVAVVLDPGDPGGHREQVLDGARGVAGVRQLGHVLGDGVVEAEAPDAHGATHQVGEHRLGHRGAEQQRLGGDAFGVPLVHHRPGVELAVKDEQSSGVGLGDPRLEAAHPTGTRDLRPQRPQPAWQRLRSRRPDLDARPLGVSLRIDERQRRQTGTITHRMLLPNGPQSMRGLFDSRRLV